MKESFYALEMVKDSFCICADQDPFVKEEIQISFYDETPIVATSLQMEIHHVRASGWFLLFISFVLQNKGLVSL